MNIQSTEAKIGAVHEVGCRLDDSLESANKDLYRAEGAVSALKQAVTLLENLATVVDKDISKMIDEGTIDLLQAKTIKNYIDRGRNQIVNLVSNAENNRITQGGKVQAFQQAVQVTKKLKDDEMNKLKMLADAIQSARVKKTDVDFEHTGEGPRPIGVHPGMSIKERRLAEVSEAVVENTDKNSGSDTQKTEEKPEEKSKRRTKKEKK